jgi:hypothetical protein
MIGGVVSHDRTVEKLGDGMGDVYKAEDTGLDRFVDLKSLPENVREIAPRVLSAPCHPARESSREQCKWLGGVEGPPCSFFLGCLRVRRCRELSRWLGNVGGSTAKP